MHRQLGCWLRSSHSFKEYVIAHWSSDTAPIIVGTKHFAEFADFSLSTGVVGEHSAGGEGACVSSAGACRRAKVGISSEN